MGEGALRSVCIAGAGPLAAHLGKALRAGADPVRVTAWDRDAGRAQAMLAAGCFDALTAFPQDALAEAEVLVIADGDARDIARRLSRFLPADAVVTDLAALKAELAPVVAEHVAAPVRYVTSLVWGVEVSASEGPVSAEAFRGALCLLGVDPVGGGADRSGVDRLEALWARVGASTRVAPWDELDIVVAAHRQLPPLAGAAWLTCLDELSEAFGTLQDLDAPRGECIAHLDELDAAALRTNRGALLSVVARMSSVLEDLRGWIEQGQWERVEELLQQARRRRGDLTRRRPLSPGSTSPPFP